MKQLFMSQFNKHDSNQFNTLALNTLNLILFDINPGNIAIIFLILLHKFKFGYSIKEKYRRNFPSSQSIPQNT